MDPPLDNDAADDHIGGDLQLEVKVFYERKNVPGQIRLCCVLCVYGLLNMFSGNTHCDRGNGKGAEFSFG